MNHLMDLNETFEVNPIQDGFLSKGFSKRKKKWLRLSQFWAKM